MFWVWSFYRGEKKGLQILLSYSQAGPGRKVKQGKEEIFRNRIVPTIFLGSVLQYFIILPVRIDRKIRHK